MRIAKSSTAGGRRRRRRPVLAAGVSALSLLLLATGATHTSALRARTAGHGHAAHQPGKPHVPHPTPEASRVGALFNGSLSDGHFCTASVVDSPGGSLIITAAHCLDDSATSLVFAPGYRDGQAPYGVWQLTGAYVDPSWTDHSDEDADVAFATVAPQDGKHLEDVVGGNKLGIDPGDARKVRLTGYPDSLDEPLSCTNTASRYGSSQLRIACSSYSSGTSGSPWLTDPDHTTHTSTVIGVIGGHQQGGDTDDVSYSSYFGPAVAALYHRATAAGG
ncbi:trypsin-like serine peptidase [Streptomyces sp. NPDC092296]|uniref:trypsin-like serine peptidase n=1 Tax=Streptomyces sp. NPDC092296 TaxID=3366012 RepID=UPI0038243D76